VETSTSNSNYFHPYIFSFSCFCCRRINCLLCSRSSHCFLMLCFLSFPGLLTWQNHYVRSVLWKHFAWILLNGEVHSSTLSMPIETSDNAFFCFLFNY
jgi:hypothetical protein